MAKKKAGGSTSNSKDSRGRRLGVKVFGGQSVTPGGIIIRQRGTKFYPGINTVMGKDHTINSIVGGTVRFIHRQNKCFVGVE